MKKIKLGMMGGGKGAFIGDTHRIGAKITNMYEVVGGVFNRDFNTNMEFAKEYGLDKSRIYHDVDELIEKELALPENERMTAVAIVTPNSSHFEIASKLVKNKFHIICDKPMTTTVAEAIELERLVKENNVVFCLTHTYTGYPMVRQMREMIKSGAIGEFQRIDVQYYQGWVNDLLQSSGGKPEIWRMDPKYTGASSCMADIGVHGFNLIEYTTGLKIKKILADLNNLKEDIPLDLDGTVLLRFDGNFKGVIRASQIATGEENNVKIAVYGSKAALKWEQEDPNYLYLISDNEPKRTYKPAHVYNSEFAQASHVMPPGHPEGIYEAFGNLYKGAAKAIYGQQLFDREFPDVTDGVRGMKFIESVVKSNKEGNVWINID